jgi:RNA-directed DNA polymerase
MQLDLFDIPAKSTHSKLLCDLFEAYYTARKNKRNTINQLRFEMQHEHHLLDLYDEIVERQYRPQKGICFIVQKPVKREIFAADFRDRVIHHLIYNYIAPIFEKSFINDSYSCRKGKGTHYGIKRMDHFIRSCSHNYTKDCYILKLDIKGYFMSMDRKLLFEAVKSRLFKHESTVDFDLPMVMYLLEKIIFNDPVGNCCVKGKRSDWQGLPKSKSLFHAPPGKGLPIGNLTSQLFGNVYLNAFDHYIKREVGIKYYGRYVDDFVLIHNSKHFLMGLIPKIADFLSTRLQLQLHPGKIYLQQFSKGLPYLGAVIKPHRIYVASRIKGNLFDAIQKHNAIVRNHKPTADAQAGFISSMNSYLGIMKHYKTYKMRKWLVFKNLSAWWWNMIRAAGYKLVLRRRLLATQVI